MLRAGLFLSLLFLASQTHAQGRSPDTVHLAGGGLLRGTLVETTLNDHVTIVLVTGEVRRVPWGDVTRIEPGAAVLPVPTVPPSQGPTAVIHITSPVPVVLDRLPAGSDAWVMACESPCDEALPLGDRYRIDGAGLRSSREFQLTAGPGARVELFIHPGKKKLRSVGMRITGIGAYFDVLGLPMLLAGIAQSAHSCAPDSPNGVYVTSDGSFTQCRKDVAEARSLRNAGIVVSAIGLVTTAVGAWLWLKNSATGVDEAPQSPAAARHVPAPSIVRLPRRPDEVDVTLVNRQF